MKDPVTAQFLGIGIDIERVNRFAKRTALTSRLIERTFTKREMAYCMSKSYPPIHFAGNFAAKEAAFKAVHAQNFGKIAMTDFEVSHNRYGVPKVNYIGGSPGVRAVEIIISISHTSENAVAIAISLPLKIPFTIGPVTEKTRKG